MISIPGTSYQISGAQIMGPDGQEVSKEQFVQKVKDKEISLSADSLSMLASHMGPTLTGSLMAASGLSVPAGDLLPKLGAGMGAGAPGSDGPDDPGSSSDGITGDVYSLMEVMAKLTQEQRKAATSVRAAEFDMQVGSLQTAADEAMNAAKWRLAAGIVSGTMTMASGALSATGGLKGTDAAMKTWGGFGSVADGAGKLIAAGLEFGAAQDDKLAKEADINAKKFEQMHAESRDMVDSIRDLNAKVMDTLRAIAAAEAEASKAVARM